MLTLYATNLAGEVMPLCFPHASYSLRDEEVCRAICPDDPSSVHIVSRSRPLEETAAHMDDEALHVLMDDLHTMASEEQEQEQEQEEDIGGWVWGEGDRVAYWIEAHELTIHLTLPMGGPYYAVSDPSCQWPLYPFTLWVEREEEVGLGKEKRVVHSWSFLFSLREGHYLAPSGYVMEVEGGGGDVYLALTPACVWHTSVEDALQADASLPLRYKVHMLRAVYRKWVRALRNMARRFSLVEREMDVMHPTEWVRDEKQFFRDHYLTLRTARKRT